jgi:hypothetical protein
MRLGSVFDDDFPKELMFSLVDKGGGAWCVDGCSVCCLEGSYSEFLRDAADSSLLAYNFRQGESCPSAFMGPGDFGMGHVSGQGSVGEGTCPGKPVVTIDSSPRTIAAPSDSVPGGTTAAITFTIAPITDGFDLTHISVTNGELSSFAGSGANYTAILSSGQAGFATIGVIGNKFKGDSISIQVTCGGVDDCSDSVDCSKTDLPLCCKSKCCCPSNGQDPALGSGTSFCESHPCVCTNKCDVNGVPNASYQPNPSKKCLCECMEGGQTKTCTGTKVLTANCSCVCENNGAILNCGSQIEGSQANSDCECKCPATNFVACPGTSKAKCVSGACPKDSEGNDQAYTINADTGACECSSLCGAGFRICVEGICECNAGTCIEICPADRREQATCKCCTPQQEIVDGKCVQKCPEDKVRVQNGDCKTCAEAAGAAGPVICNGLCYAACAANETRNAGCTCIRRCLNDCYEAPGCAPIAGAPNCKPWEFLSRNPNDNNNCACEVVLCNDGSAPDPDTGACGGGGDVPVGGGGGSVGSGGGGGGGGGGCPSNSTLRSSDNQCYCNAGYTMNSSGDGCVSIDGSSSTSGGGGTIIAKAVKADPRLGPTVCNDVICPPNQCCHDTVFGFECRGC